MDQTKGQKDASIDFKMAAIFCLTTNLKHFKVMVKPSKVLMFLGQNACIKYEARCVEGRIVGG